MGNTHTYRYIKVPAKPSIDYVSDVIPSTNPKTITCQVGDYIFLGGSGGITSFTNATLIASTTTNYQSFKAWLYKANSTSCDLTLVSNSMISGMVVRI